MDYWETRPYIGTDGQIHYMVVKVIGIGSGTDYEDAIYDRQESEYD